MTGTELRPYQLADVSKFVGVPACLIGHEKRVGKTIISLALTLQRLEHETSSGPILIVSDKTSQWTRDFTKMGIPSETLHLVDRPARKKFQALLENPQPGHFYQIHWAGLRAEFVRLAPIRWHTVIADEVHAAKNPKAQRTRALKTMSTKYKVGLTADPSDNAPQDIWSLLNWLYPKQYPSFWRWVRRYIEVFTENGKHGEYFVFGKPLNVEEFRAEIEPFFTRLTLKDIDPGQVPHIYEEHYVDMTSEQRVAYEQMLELDMMEIGADTVMCEYPMVAAMRLQQLAQAMGVCEKRQVWREVTEDDPQTGEPRKVRRKVDTVRVRQVEPSPKLDDMMATLTSVDRPPGPTVIFSQFPDMIRLACKRMDKAGLKYAVVTESSQINDAERAFQVGEVDTLVGSVWLINESIELSRLQTEIFIDCPWNPRVRGQAIARGQAVGRRDPIRVIDIRTRSSVDLVRLDRAQTKQAWRDLMLGGIEDHTGPSILDMDLV